MGDMDIAQTLAEQVNEAAGRGQPMRRSSPQSPVAGPLWVERSPAVWPVRAGPGEVRHAT